MTLTKVYYLNDFFRITLLLKIRFICFLIIDSVRCKQLTIGVTIFLYKQLINHKSIKIKMKKIIFVFTLLVSCLSFSQVISSVDFHVLNSGMENDYLKLEQIWNEFHKKNMEDGKMIRWTMLKVKNVKRRAR